MVNRAVYGHIVKSAAKLNGIRNYLKEVPFNNWMLLHNVQHIMTYDFMFSPDYYFVLAQNKQII